MAQTPGKAVAARRGWDWIASGWALFRKSPLVWIAWVVLLVLLILVLLSIGAAVGRLLLILLGPAIMGGVALGCRDLDEGRPMPFKRLFAGFGAHASKHLAVGALCAGAAALIVAAVVLGTGVDLSSLRSPQDVLALSPAQLIAILLAMLIILALLIPVAMAAWFAPLLVAFAGRGPVAALRDSFAASLRNMVPMLVYGLILLPLAFAATVSLLGWLVLLPVLLASIYTSYKDIFTAPAPQ